MVDTSILLSDQEASGPQDSHHQQERWQHLTVFGLPTSQPLVMPFGLSGAPAMIQHVLDDLLQGMGHYATAYLDNLVAYRYTGEELRTHIQHMLQPLIELGLTEKAVQCQFGM